MIKLSKSYIDKKDIKSVQNIMKKMYLGMGPEVLKFEKILSKYFGRNCACVSTGTAALQLAVQAAGLKRGDEIIVPSLTYVASFQAISANGAKPVSCDVNQKNLSLCIEDLKKKITKKTKAIMPVHYAGNTGDLDEIYNIAKKKKLRVIEDAAHAFGSNYKGKKVGSIGDIACFSFDGIKNITSGEGGCVVSSDKKIIKKIKNLRLLGIINESNKRYKGKKGFDIDVREQGWRYHMSDLNAALGISQFKKKEFFKKKKKTFLKYYLNLLKSFNKIQFLDFNYDEIFQHIFVIILDSKFDRNTFRKLMLKKKIETGFHWKPANQLSFFKDKIKLKKTENIEKKLVTLPLHVGLSKKDVLYVVKSLKKILD